MKTVVLGVGYFKTAYACLESYRDNLLIPNDAKVFLLMVRNSSYKSRDSTKMGYIEDEEKMLELLGDRLGKIWWLDDLPHFNFNLDGFDISDDCWRKRDKSPEYRNDVTDFKEKFVKCFIMEQSASKYWKNIAIDNLGCTEFKQSQFDTDRNCTTAWFTMNQYLRKSILAQLVNEYMIENNITPQYLLSFRLDCYIKNKFILPEITQKNTAHYFNMHNDILYAKYEDGIDLITNYPYHKWRYVKVHLVSGKRIVPPLHSPEFTMLMYLLHKGYRVVNIPAIYDGSYELNDDTVVICMDTVPHEGPQRYLSSNIYKFINYSENRDAKITDPNTVMFIDI